MAHAAGPGRTTASRQRPRRILAAAALVWIVAWLVLHSAPSGDEVPTPAPPTSPSLQIPLASNAPRAMDVAQLAELPGRVGHEVLWAGPVAGDTYEVTVTGVDVYVRYLPPGVAVGSPLASFLTVGTYRETGALAKLQGARAQATFVRSLPGGGLAVTPSVHPDSVYLAFPGRPMLVEVYAEHPGQARAAVLAGQIAPVP